MRICFVSTYPPIECGIATYCSDLIEPLKTKSNEIYVVSQHGGTGENVFAAFNSSDPDLADRIFNMLVKFTPDVVHIQHEFGLYGPMSGVNIIPLIYSLRMVGIPVVVTIHTVYRDISREHKIILDPIIRGSDAVIVHEEYQKEVINSTFDNPEHIFVIPHGVRDLRPVKDSKELLGLSGKKVILLAGYFRPGKGFLRIVKIFPEIVKRVPEATLVVASKMRIVEYSEDRNSFFDEINRSPVRDKIKVFCGQFPQKTLDTVISAADVVPFSYTTGAQSGMLAQILAFKKPFVASDLESFKNIAEKTKGGVIATSDGEYIDSISHILEDNDYAAQLSGNIKKYVESNLKWDIIANRHIEVYHKVLELPCGDAEYVCIV
ncbi:MAG: Glycosyl transferases group 1 [Candidatus Syntrophoarchaeum sp. GoM_oil]|nr:MAG: Glycosyl transferases group 1 [Candidatus Syntrophoarchaeum sp. GoM_oil]